MTRSKVKVKVKVTEDRKLSKWPSSRSISSANIHVIERLTMNYDSTRHLKTFPARFLILFLVRCHVTLKFRVSSYEQ